MKTKNSYLMANHYTNMDTANFALSDFSATGLSELQLFIFSGCETGKSHNTYGNLVDMALSRKARLALGFTQTTFSPHSSYYMNYFTQSLRGRSVQGALDNADSWAGDGIYYQPLVNSKYWGSSRFESVNFA